MGRLLGIDIGASNVRTCVVQDERILLYTKKKLDISNPPSSVLRQVKEMAGPDVYDAAGISVAGFVSTREGIIVSMPNTGIASLNIASELSSLSSKRPVVVNDAVAAVYSEWVAGGKREIDMMYLTFSTGIGGAAILNGCLVAGREGNSHEVGHIIVDKRGLLVCGCGKRGHWEAYCSGRGLVNYFMKYASKKGKELKVKESSEIFSSEERLAKEFLQEAIKMNSVGLASVLNIFNPGLLIVGGSLGLNNWQSYILPSFELASQMLILNPPELSMSLLQDAASCYGAALLAGKLKIDSPE